MRDKWRLWRGGAPLPIPNREVKPRRDDDTAGDRGKVVRRPPTTDSPSALLAGLSVFVSPCPVAEKSALSFAETDLLLPLQVIGRSPVQINKHEYEETIANSLVGICRMPRA